MLQTHKEERRLEWAGGGRERPSLAVAQRRTGQGSISHCVKSTSGTVQSWTRSRNINCSTLSQYTPHTTPAPHTTPHHTPHLIHILISDLACKLVKMVLLQRGLISKRQFDGTLQERVTHKSPHACVGTLQSICYMHTYAHTQGTPQNTQAQLHTASLPYNVPLQRLFHCKVTYQRDIM